MGFDLDQFWTSESEEHTRVAQETFESVKASFSEMLALCKSSITNGGKVLLFGNGGSAADAQHLATEFTVRYVKNRAPIAAIALTTDTSALTAAGNDLGFEHIFARQIEALGKPNDVAIGISTSGQSANVLHGLKQARAMGIKTIGFTGEKGSSMGDSCDVMIQVPSSTTARIQEMHITIGQMLCSALEQELSLV